MDEIKQRRVRHPTTSMKLEVTYTNWKMEIPTVFTNTVNTIPTVHSYWYYYYCNYYFGTY